MIGRRLLLSDYDPEFARDIAELMANPVATENNCLFCTDPATFLYKDGMHGLHPLRMNLRCSNSRREENL